MNALIDYIQKEIHITYNRKYSKKYIEDKLVPIINYINSSKSKNSYLEVLRVLVNHHLLILFLKLLKNFMIKKYFCLV